MHLLPIERVNALNLRPLRQVQLSHSTDNKVGCDLISLTIFRLFAALGRLDADLPFLARVVPSGVLDHRVEAEVWQQLEVLSDILEVGEDLFLAGILARPRWVFGEAVGVEGGPDIAAAAGIFVVEPGKDPWRKQKTSLTSSSGQIQLTRSLPVRRTSQ